MSHSETFLGGKWEKSFRVIEIRALLFQSYIFKSSRMLPQSILFLWFHFDTLYCLCAYSIQYLIFGLNLDEKNVKIFQFIQFLHMTKSLNYLSQVQI